MVEIYASDCGEISEREVQHQRRVRQLAPEGMVLLKNKGVLPLYGTKQIALYGVGARKTVKGGTGSGDVNSREVITIEQGIEKAGISVTTKEWLDCYDRIYEEGYRTYIQEGRRKIENGTSLIEILFGDPFFLPEESLITEEDVKRSETDTAVYVISRNSGEGADRTDTPGDYRLRERECENLRFLGSHYKKMVVLLNVGGAIEMEELEKIEGIDAILLVSQIGNISGDVVADVLLGKSYPSGKLTTTWAKTYKEYPFGEEFSQNNGDLDDSFYREGIYVGYRYFDTFGLEPAYPFGYGLGYASFQIVESKLLRADEEIVQIEATVENISSGSGFEKGKEVVQVYVSKPEGILEQSYQELVAFEKTAELCMGEQQKLEIAFPTKRLASYDAKRACWCMEPGEYLIRVGNCSRSTKVIAKLYLDQEVILEQDRNLFALDQEFEELKKQDNRISYHYPTEQEEIQAALVWKLDAKQFNTRTVIYQTKRKEVIGEKEKQGEAKNWKLTDVIAKKATLEELVSQMTEEEMATLCVGRGWEMEAEGDASVGSASLAVPGAAGDTTIHFVQSRGIRNMVLADGPAGLRLTPEFQLDKNGMPISSGMALPMYADLINQKQEKQPGKTYYQYTTAIPIATMLAQTWNTDVLMQMGDLVGTEMEEFGVTLWLAPGMNLHRNVLCGRNFEYYSEDPLISGCCAAAVTKGVQKHRGTGVTIKHFALNNQENNRCFNNSHIKERAIRELYLKGFEFCVKEAQPMAVMTSYNLLNGVHTANRADLLTAVLRDEWGFEGLVMTDWGTTGNQVAGLAEKGKAYPASTAPGCIAAGNDLIMPGIKRDREEILAAVGTTIQKADLQAAVMHILKILMKSARYEKKS